MTDRMFTACCYGTDWQHTETQDCPLALHFDSSTDIYRDRFNDVFVSQPLGRKMWEVTSRGGGNVTEFHSRHRSLDAALARAEDVIRTRLAA